MSKECNAEPAAANTANAPASGTPGARAARFPGTAGTVQAISGSTVTVKGLQNNATVTVQLSDNTTIRKQVTKAITDLQPGMQIFALGQLSGNTLTAWQIQVLAPGETAPAGGFGFNGNANGGANVGNGGDASGNAGAGANGGNGGNRGTGGNGGAGRAGSFVNGSIDSVSGSTITVKKSDGSTATVTLASGGRIVEQSTGTTSDIKPGEFLTATGQQQGDALVATAASLSDQAPQFVGQAQAGQ